VKPETLVGAIAAVFIFGLGAIIFLMMAMKMVFGAEYLPLVIAFTLLSFLIMLAVEGVFVGMLRRGKKGAKEAARELSEAKARVLPEPPLSVTEHTTNLLETADRNHQK
jgi:divalent metal cation (Fe/Co/Zn/Cd) transporter